MDIKTRQSNLKCETLLCASKEGKLSGSMVAHALKDMIHKISRTGFLVFSTDFNNTLPTIILRISYVYITCDVWVRFIKQIHDNIHSI